MANDTTSNTSTEAVLVGHKGVKWAMALVGVLLLAACSNSGESESDDPVVLDIDAPANTELASPMPDTATTTTSFGPLDLNAIGAEEPAVEGPSVASNGLEVGFTAEGYPYRGSSDATVTLVEFSDYACPFCGRHTAQTAPLLLEQYGTTGQVRFVFREFPLVSLHPTAPIAHAVAVCAGEQSAELYWSVHDGIFANQDAWTTLPDPTASLVALAEGAGVEAVALQECIDSGRATDVVNADVATAQSFGFNGTPSFQVMADAVEGTYDVIGAQPVEVFQSYLDSLLAGEVPDGAVPGQEAGEDPEPQGLPAWADRVTGLQPDPDRPGVNMAGDYYKGDPAAPLVVVEFSDFECPFCGVHTLETQPTVDATFVDTGQVMWVYKHLPLPMHPSARNAAVAAECAGDQGQFWEMHDLLFETVERWAGEGVDTDLALVQLAAESGLDAAAFGSCFESRSALERVLTDMDDANGIISETPSFVVIQGERGSLLSGAQPVDEFVAILQARLDEVADS